VRKNQKRWQNNMKNVTIYTDGACSGNPGPGGWGVVLLYKGNEKRLSGYEADTTNNRMEMTAVLEALTALKEPCKVTLYTDSAYIHNAFEKGWVDRWLANGWKTAAKKPVENQDLWQGILKLLEKHTVVWRKVKGHAGDKYNEACDQLARQAIQSHK
jgi:ribonuclease HI